MDPTSDLPAFTDFGILTQFDIDVPGQAIRLTCVSKVVGIDAWVYISGKFEGVSYLKLVSDLPVSFYDNGIDSFAERSDSDALNGIEEKEGWTFLRTDIDTATLGGPGRRPEALRYFLIQSSFISAEWICVLARFSYQILER